MGRGTWYRRRRRRTVEECARLDATRDAPPEGTSLERVASNLGRGWLRFFRCPTCDRRAKYLYRAGRAWRCRVCLNLTYHSNNVAQRRLREAAELARDFGAPLADVIAVLRPDWEEEDRRTAHLTHWERWQLRDF